MRDRYSQAKSTNRGPSLGKGRTFLLVILAAVSVICAVCAFSLMPRSAISYAASWPLESECKSEVELECNVYAYGHEGEEDYRYKVSLIFEEAADELVQGEGYVFNKYPKYYKITIPGYISDEEYKCNARNSSFGYTGAGIAVTSSSFTISSTIYAPTPISTIMSLESFEDHFKSANYYILFTKYETVYSNGQWVEVDGSSEQVEIFFSIHTDPPSLASIPEYTNSNFTIGSDGDGGVIDRIYVCDANREVIVEYEGESYTVNIAELSDGQYYVYAEDVLGQRSAESPVYVDRVAPTISSVSEEKYFYITGDDNLGCGVVHIEDECGNVVSDTYEYLLYKEDLEYDDYVFYAVDAAGNRSEPVTVVYSAESALGYFSYELGSTEEGKDIYCLSFGCVDTAHYDAYVTLYESDSQNSEVLIAETAYTYGDIYTQEGYYEFALVSNVDGAMHYYNYTLGHEYVQADDTDASSRLCTDLVLLVCLQCGDETYGSVGTMQHDFSGEDGRVLTGATCTECAYYTYSCSRCNYSYIEEIPDTEKGHNNTQEYFMETCTEDGYYAPVCTVCGYVDMEYATVFEGTASGHAYFDDKSYEGRIEPTCTEVGIYKFVCDRCGDWYTQTINAYGHDFSIYVGEWYDEEADNMYYYYQCSVCGAQEERITYKYKSGTIVAILDWFDNFQYWIWIIFGACVAVWGIVVGVRYIMAQGQDNHEKAKKQIVNLVLGILVIAVICLCVPYLIELVCELLL